MSVLTELPRVLRSGIRRRGVPGASVSVLRNGRVVAEAAAGFANLDTGVRTTTDTLFQIGSITKPFTTTLIMQLEDEGKVDLDTPVVTWLPKFRVADACVTREVTPRHLLSHQSGIDGDFFVDSGRGDESTGKLVDMAAMMPNLFPIGEKHSYCNLGFAILGSVAEVITGKTYDTLLRERIYEPLGMDHAISLPEDIPRFRVAVGHLPGGRGKKLAVTKTPYLSFGQKAAGSTPTMTTGDLLKFSRMHLDGGRNAAGKRLLFSRSVKAMQRRQIQVQKHTSRGVTHWGLGWMLFDWNGTKLYGHDGGTPGQSAFLRILPEKNLAVAMLTNGGDTGGLFQDVYGHLFGGLARTSEPLTPEPADGLKVDLDKYTGRYGNLNYFFELTKLRGTLRVTQRLDGQDAPVMKPAPLAFVDANTAVLRSGDPVRDRTIMLFSDKRDGKMQYVCAGLRQHRRVS